MRAVPVGDECDDWVGLSAEALPVDAAVAWAHRPDCGAVVSFLGTVRDHAEGRVGVTHLDYEAYEEQVEPQLASVARDVRAKWPDTGRVVLLHRVGRVELSEAAVIVVVSSPHRGEAFEAARFAIDTIKHTVPIWKRESWEDGEAWGHSEDVVDKAASS